MSKPKTTPSVFTVTMPAKSLSKILRAMLLTASKDRTRVHLNAVSLEVDANGARFVSTDGHRLTVYAIDQKCVDAERYGRTLIARDDVRSIIAECQIQPHGPVTLDAGRSRFTREHSARVLSWKPVNATFPPYVQVMPAEATLPCGKHIAPEYLVDAGRAFRLLGGRMPTLTIRQGTSDVNNDIAAPAVILGSVKELFILIMAMRADEPEASLKRFRPAPQKEEPAKSGKRAA